MKFQPKQPEELDLNITPLIDVVFLLLIFFMVSTTFDHESEVNITLPKASKEIAQAKPDAINVAIDNESRIFINKKELVNSQISTIKEALYDISADLEDAPIIISADEETPYQVVIRTMDAARQLGLIKITFATRINEEDY
ncbi:MAG: biopolymer transporter ExbD [Gammaproteobacteria bacterium]|nr:MAG: biopolymer transporter ExbD [Gammaproteobacteria bacterium]